MTPAAEKFRSILDETEIALPNVPVASNVTGEFHESDGNSIRMNLYRQLFKPVRWYSNLMTIANAEVDVVIEFGGGLGSENDPATETAESGRNSRTSVSTLETQTEILFRN